MKGCIDAIRSKFANDLTKSHINLSSEYRNGFHAALKEVEDRYIDTKEMELQGLRNKYECKVKELSDQYEGRIQILEAMAHDSQNECKEYKAKWEVIELLFGKGVNNGK